MTTQTSMKDTIARTPAKTAAKCAWWFGAGLVMVRLLDVVRHAPLPAWKLLFTGAGMLCATYLLTRDPKSMWHRFQSQANWFTNGFAAMCVLDVLLDHGFVARDLGALEAVEASIAFSLLAWSFVRWPRAYGWHA